MGDINNDIMIDYQGIADRVRKERKRLKMSQHMFADECAIDRQILSRIERGYGTSLENYCRIAGYLNVTLDDLIGGQVSDAASVIEELLMKSLDNIREAIKLMKP